jgi:hypothetical protein
MSLTISRTPAEVELDLLKLGVFCRFTDQEHSRYATTPVVSCDAPVFGFPTPEGNSSLTLAAIKASVGVDPLHQPAFFDHPWYPAEAFMETRCPPGWHFLTMDVLKGSIGQPVDYGRSLQGIELPLAIEVVLMLVLHYVQSGEQLLSRKHTWCSDIASQGRAVTVGAFGRNGLFLSGHPRNFASRGLGICGRINGR